MVNVKQRYQLKLPKKSDYPDRLKILDKPNRSAAYHQLIEASASAYFETKGPTKWIFFKRFQVAFDYLNQLVKLNHYLMPVPVLAFFYPV